MARRRGYPAVGEDPCTSGRKGDRAAFRRSGSLGKVWASAARRRATVGEAPVRCVAARSQAGQMSQCPRAPERDKRSLGCMGTLVGARARAARVPRPGERSGGGSPALLRTK
eukprot:5044721-Heterocapsa_arctica.AAC.1